MLSSCAMSRFRRIGAMRSRRIGPKVLGPACCATRFRVSYVIIECPWLLHGRHVCSHSYPACPLVRAYKLPHTSGCRGGRRGLPRSRRQVRTAHG
jgi:hypothetical protein